MCDIQLFGLKLNNIGLIDCAERIIKSAEQNKSEQIYFLNAHCINTAAKNPRYLVALEQATALYADGIGMKLASIFSGCKLVDNVNGTDLFPILCQKLADTDVTLALIGAKPGIARLCAEKMTQQFPGLKIVWSRDGYFDKAEERKMIVELNSIKPDIILVAMGVPQQELWIKNNHLLLSTPIMIGVGALFDFYSGNVSRAPKIIRRLGCEWFYRFLLEPRRLFKRYILGNPLFLLRVIKLRLFGKERIKNTRLIRGS